MFSGQIGDLLATILWVPPVGRAVFPGRSNLNGPETREPTDAHLRLNWDAGACSIGRISAIEPAVTDPAKPIRLP